MKKVLLMIAMSFLLIGCALKDAQKEYENGNYIKSVHIVVSYLDKKNKLPKEKEKKQIIGMFKNIISHYENELDKTSIYDYDGRVRILLDLLQIRELTNNKFYENEINFFTSKYTTDSIKEMIAKECYNKGNSIGKTTENDLKNKYEAYYDGLSYYPYKDIQILYNDTKKEYHEFRAENFYKDGLVYEEQKNYTKAEEEFKKSVEEYKEYGSYKDAEIRRKDNRVKKITKIADDYYEAGKLALSKKSYCSTVYNFDKAHTSYLEVGKYKDALELSKKYKEDCQKEKSREYYESALKKIEKAKTKKDYRSIASDFYNSHREYGKDGFNNAKEMQTKYSEMGIVRVYIKSSEANGEVRNAIDTGYIAYVNSVREADITIEIEKKENYSDKLNKEISNESLTETVKIGETKEADENGAEVVKPVYKDFSFKRIKTEDTNKYTLNAKVSVTGIMSFYRVIDLTEESRYVKITYTGDLPPDKYKNTTEGTWYNRDNLSSKIEKQYKEKLNEELKKMSSMIGEL